MARQRDTSPSFRWRARVVSVSSGFTSFAGAGIARRRTSRRAERWLLGSNGVRPPLSP